MILNGFDVVSSNCKGDLCFTKGDYRLLYCPSLLVCTNMLVHVYKNQCKFRLEFSSLEAAINHINTSSEEDRDHDQSV